MTFDQTSPSGVATASTATIRSHPRRPRLLRAALYAGLTATLAFASACPPSGHNLPTEKVGSDFEFERDAFSFPNFGGVAFGSTVNPALMARMFGESSVCNPDFAGTCRLLPIANEYRAAVNQSLRGGRCEGFAVLSGLAARGEVDLSVFGSSVARDLELEDNRPLGEEIAYWFTTQYLRDVVPESTRPLGAVAAVEALNEAFSAPAHEMFRLGIARLDPETGALAGGHAVLATYVAPGESDDQYVVGIYDNNHPEAEREILVDASAGSWTYQASSTPDDPDTVYGGDGGNNNPIYLSPVEPRRGTHPCTFCKEGDAGEEALAQIFGSASAELIAIHADGRRVGERDGALVDEHDGDGHALPSFTAACHECRDGTHSVAPHDPDEGTTLELRTAVHAPTVDGVVEDLYAAYFGHGFVVTVEGADVESGESHSVLIPGDGAGALYTSETPSALDETDVAIGAVVGDDEQVFAEVRVVGAESVELVVDREIGDPTLTVRGPLTGATVTLTIETTIGVVTRQFIVEFPPPLAGSATVVLADSVDGGDVVVEVDNDGDGQVDVVLTLPDLG